jgi:hypothetical protein
MKVPFSAFCFLLSAFCFLPSAFCFLPSAFCFLLSAFCFLLSGNDADRARARFEHSLESEDHDSVAEHDAVLTPVDDGDAFHRAMLQGAPTEVQVLRGDGKRIAHRSKDVVPPHLAGPAGKARLACRGAVKDSERCGGSLHGRRIARCSESDVIALTGRHG